MTNCHRKLNDDNIDKNSKHENNTIKVIDELVRLKSSRKYQQ